MLTLVAANFVVNMVFVVVSRTALVTLPVMLAVFAMAHLKWRTNVLLFVAAVVFGALAWTVSPQLQATTDKFTRDYRIYKELNQPTSIGLRLEFWEKSLRFFAEAPVIGHGTGSTRGLFEAAATGPAVLAQGQVIGNPHNQTLNVAVQWGTVGVVILYAMWLSHFAAVPRRGAGGLDRADGGAAEHVQFAVQLASVRFSRGMDVCAGRRHRRRHGAARQSPRPRNLPEQPGHDRWHARRR